MVQDFTTSFDRFEIFALSEMAKQPDLKNDTFSPFTPKYWTNRESINSLSKSNSLTSLYEAQLEGNIQYLSPRRSGRIANQTKINYNENIPKKTHKQKQTKRQKKSNASSKKNASNVSRTKAIRRLFKKPSDGDNVKAKTKPETNSYKTRGKVSKMPITSLKISIPLIHTKLLTTSVTKASLKLYEDVQVTENPEHPDSSKMEVSDEKCVPVERKPVVDNFKYWSFKNAAKRKSKAEQKFVCEAFETSVSSTLKTINTLTKNKLTTESESEHVSGRSFSGIFKTNKDNEEVVSVNPWKKNDKLKQNPNGETVEEKKLIPTSDRKIEKQNANKSVLENKSKQSTNLTGIVEVMEDRERSLDDLMEISSETQKPNVLEDKNEIPKDYQMMEISNESTECLDETPHNPVQNDNEVLQKTYNPEQSSTKEVSGEKEFPLDLSIMDVSEEFWKPNKIAVRTKSIITEYEFSENSTIMEVSSDVSLPSAKRTSSNEAEKCSPLQRLSIFDSFKKNTQIDHQNISKLSWTEKTENVQKFSILKNRNGKTTAATLAFEECSLLSENLSTMKISHKNHQKSKSVNYKAFQNTDEPFDLTITELSEEVPHSKSIKDSKIDTPTSEDKVSDNIESSNDNCDSDVIIVEQNNATEVLQNHRSQSSSSSGNDVLDTKERKIVDELKSMIEKGPQDRSATSNVVNLVEISSDFENPAETGVYGEVETCEESNASETEDDEEMSHHRVYQQEFIEVIQQYNYFPFQNYQYPRYEYPVEENQFNYRPTNNLSFLSQCYGELQVPQQMNLVDYNNYRSYRQFEPESKLEITEYVDSDEEKEKEKEKDKQNTDQHKTTQNQNLKPRSSSDCKLPALSQPTPMECNSQGRCPPLQNNQKTQFDLQPQSQIGQRISAENSNKSNNNQCKIVSHRSTQTSSEQRDFRQLYENDCGIQELDNQPGPQVNQSQNIHRHPPQTQTIQINHQVKSQNNAQQGYQELSHIADFLKNNCHIHDVKFGKIKTLNGRLYRTGSLLITFGDHYKVQVIGDVILNSMDENTAFDAFFSPSNNNY